MRAEDIPENRFWRNIGSMTIRVKSKSQVSPLQQATVRAEEDCLVLGLWAEDRDWKNVAGGGESSGGSRQGKVSDGSAPSRTMVVDAAEEQYQVLTGLERLCKRGMVGYSCVTAAEEEEDEDEGKGENFVRDEYHSRLVFNIHVAKSLFSTKGSDRSPELVLLLYHCCPSMLSLGQAFDASPLTKQEADRRRLGNRRLWNGLNPKQYSCVVDGCVVHQ